MLKFVGRFGSPVNGFIGGEGGGLWMRGAAAAGPGAGEESRDTRGEGKGERSAGEGVRRAMHAAGNRTIAGRGAAQGKVTRHMRSCSARLHRSTASPLQSVTASLYLAPQSTTPTSSNKKPGPHAATHTPTCCHAPRLGCRFCRAGRASTRRTSPWSTRGCHATSR